MPTAVHQKLQPASNPQAIGSCGTLVEAYAHWEGSGSTMKRNGDEIQAHLTQKVYDEFVVIKNVKLVCEDLNGYKLASLALASRGFHPKCRVL